MNRGGFIDSKLLFSNAQEVTSSAASSYEIDTGEANANLGDGTPLAVEFIIETTFTGGTSMTFELQDSADGSSYTTLVEVPAVAEASLTKGATIPKLMVPPEHKRYLQMYYTVSGTHGAGKVTAYLQPVM